jgi:hypothetical protein
MADLVIPGLPAKALGLACRLPLRAFGAVMQPMRLRPFRRVAWGWMTRRSDAATRRFIEPILLHGEIRRDAVRGVRAAVAEPDVMLKAADGRAAVDRPALVVWAAEDRMTLLEHARRIPLVAPRMFVREVAQRDARAPARLGYG